MPGSVWTVGNELASPFACEASASDQASGRLRLPHIASTNEKADCRESVLGVFHTFSYIPSQQCGALNRARDGVIAFDGYRRRNAFLSDHIMPTKIDTVTARSKLRGQRAPYWHRLSSGCFVRRCRVQLVKISRSEVAESLENARGGFATINHPYPLSRHYD